jgi:hypothetical protein
MNIGTLQYKTQAILTATASGAGKVEFKANGKYIPGCRNKAVNAGNSFTANCNYYPSIHGLATITAIFIPSDVGYLKSSSNSVTAPVAARSNRR